MKLGREKRVFDDLHATVKPYLILILWDFVFEDMSDEFPYFRLWNVREAKHIRKFKLHRDLFEQKLFI